MPTISKRLSAIMLGTAISTLMISGCSNANDSTPADADTAAATDASNEDMIATAPVATGTEATSTDNVAATDTSSTDSTDAALSEVMVDAGDNGTASNQKSIVTNTTTVGSPEDTVKKAMNATYYGNVKDAVDYYKVDMADFEQQLADTQAAFQKTVDSITLTNTTYNDDKSKATVNGELMLKGQEQPTPAVYDLEKVNGKWKILG